MKGLIFGALLVWTVPDPSCGAAQLKLWEVYVNGPGTGISSWSPGWRYLPPTQSSFDLAPGKPVPECAIGWRAPIAIDGAGNPLPETCQPVMGSVDGQGWEGM